MKMRVLRVFAGVYFPPHARIQSTNIHTVGGGTGGWRRRVLSCWGGGNNLRNTRKPRFPGIRALAGIAGSLARRLTAIPRNLRGLICDPFRSTAGLVRDPSPHSVLCAPARRRDDHPRILAGRPRKPRKGPLAAWLGAWERRITVAVGRVVVRMSLEPRPPLSDPRPPAPVGHASCAADEREVA